MPLHSGTVISWHAGSFADEEAAEADEEDDEEAAAAAATADAAAQLERCSGDQAGSKSGRKARASR